MSKEQAAIADVVAKMRRFADRHWMHPACQVVREFADMIDSVLKRDCEVVVSKNATTTKESLAVGNAAKLREALATAIILLKACEWPDDTPMQDVAEVMDEIEKTLSAPPRNCDVGTADEQAERFILFCRRNSFRGVCNDSCKFANVNRRLGWQEIGQARCFPFWAQMPYEESGVRQ